MANEEGQNYGTEEKQVASQGEEDKETHTAEKLAGTSVFIFVIVIAPAASTAGGPTRDRGFAAGAGLPAFDLGGSGSKNGRHRQPL
jgi:hypothetical protein